MTLRVNNYREIDAIKGLRSELSRNDIKIKGNKYKNNGIYISPIFNGEKKELFFPSQKEANFFLCALTWQQNGDIRQLQKHPHFDLQLKNENGRKISYIADLMFENISLALFPLGTCVIDVKSSYTRKLDLFQLKWALVKKIYSDFNFVVFV